MAAIDRQGLPCRGCGHTATEFPVFRVDNNLIYCSLECVDKVVHAPYTLGQPDTFGVRRVLPA